MSTFFASHDVIAMATFIGVFFSLGCFEGFVLKSEGMAFISWWIALSGLTGWIIYPLTTPRICTGLAVFVAGCGLMISFARWLKKQPSR